jgi:hypothetical protein
MIACLPQAACMRLLFSNYVRQRKGRQKGLSLIQKSYHLEPQIAILPFGFGRLLLL